MKVKNKRAHGNLIEMFRRPPRHLSIKRVCEQNYLFGLSAECIRVD
jgi:hypothetical protein